MTNNNAIRIFVSVLFAAFISIQAHGWSLFNKKSPEEIQACEERYVIETTRNCVNDERKEMDKMSDDELLMVYGSRSKGMESAQRTCAAYWAKAVKTYNVCR